MDLNRRSVVTGLVAASLCPVCLARGAAADGHPHWTYDGDEGPEHWGDIKPNFKACSLGTQQSPIDLARPIHTNLPPLDLRWQDMPLRVINNGHTIQLAVPPGSVIAQDGDTYGLRQFHFHHPSEHTVDGQRHAMEIHFVHLNEAETAAIVLGVFVVPGEENPVLKTIWAHLPAGEGETTAEVRIHPAGLLPENADRFRYKGSLTTPPCSEIIDWNVIRQPITASQAQIDTFAALFPNNIRPLTPLNRRFVLEG